MSYIVKLVISISVIFLPAWLFQIDHNQWNYIRQNLKETNNIAAHDALILGLNNTELAQGRFIIDRTNANKAFRESLSINLGLDVNLSPKPGSPMKYPVEILYFEIIDDSNATFPFLYEKPEYNIVEYLHGPAIVSVIQSKQPVLLNIKSQKTEILAPTVYHYKTYK